MFIDFLPSIILGLIVIVVVAVILLVKRAVQSKK
jgi:hypothetical protein